MSSPVSRKRKESPLKNVECQGCDKGVCVEGAQMCSECEHYAPGASCWCADCVEQKPMLECKECEFTICDMCRLSGRVRKCKHLGSDCGHGCISFKDCDHNVEDDEKYKPIPLPTVPTTVEDSTSPSTSSVPTSVEEIASPTLPKEDPSSSLNPPGEEPLPPSHSTVDASSSISTPEDTLPSPSSAHDQLSQQVQAVEA